MPFCRQYVHQDPETQIDSAAVLMVWALTGFALGGTESALNTLPPLTHLIFPVILQSRSQLPVHCRDEEARHTTEKLTR